MGTIEIRKDIAFAGCDGQPFKGVLYRPAGVGPHPVLVAVHGGGWKRGSPDSYAVLGPWIVTIDEMGDPDAVDTRLEVNGEVIQRSNTRELAFNMREIIAHASTFYTLLPGDVIMVGTPVGFAPVRVGDTVVADFSGIGRMEVLMRAHGR